VAPTPQNHVIPFVPRLASSTGESFSGLQPACVSLLAFCRTEIVGTPMGSAFATLSTL
jgi:hypothetical protein